MKHLKIVIFVSMILSCRLFAQLDAYQNPPGKYWKMVRTPSFTIIVPEVMLAEAQRVANTLEYVKPPLEKTLYTRLKRWPLVLNAYSTVANGGVMYLPRKSEWYPTGPQSEFGGTLDWYQMLAVHEGRHMVQFDAFDRGLNHLMKIAFGDIGLGAMSFFGTPMWFIEGDAVAMETVLSNSGRGRQPVFDMGIRTLLLSRTPYSYYKAYLQSYADYYPDYYALGYQMVTHVRRKYGALSWIRIMQRSADHSYWPYSFSRSMKKIIGRNAEQVYGDTMSELRALWTQQIDSLNITPAKPVIRRRDLTWTNYLYPQGDSDGNVIALKTGMDDPYTLVRLFADGSEKIALPVGYTDGISANAGKITWSEQQTDPYWWSQSFSNVVVYDMQSDTRQQITKQGKYFAPAVSTDGQKIVAVKTELDRSCSLVILDSQTGAEIMHFSDFDSSFLKTPAWSEDGREIVFTRQKNGLRSLTVLNVETGKHIDLIRESAEDISYPVFYGNFILYDSPWSGIDNIYAIHTETQKRYQVTSRKFGSFYPRVKDSTLLFCDYQVTGMDVVQTRLDTTLWIPLENAEQRLVNYFEPLIEQEQGGNILVGADIPKEQYPVENYSPLLNSLNVHSWYFIPLSPYVFCGIISNDLLNTMELTAGLTYHSGEKACAYSLGMSYAGIRPIIDAEISFGQRTAWYKYQDEDSLDVWNEAGISGTFCVPINKSSGADNSVFNIDVTLGYSKVTDHEFMAQDDRYFNEIQYVETYLSHSKHRHKSCRDIQIMNGHDLQLSGSLGNTEDSQHEFRVSGLTRVYFPGLFKHHGFIWTMAFEKQKNPDRHIFQSQIPFTRGYYQYYFEFFKYASLSYNFPLAYPDLEFGSWLFVKRFNVGFFYDYGLGDRATDTCRSMGIELTSDFNPLALYYLELNAGVRISKRLDMNDIALEIIIADITF